MVFTESVIYETSFLYPLLLSLFQAVEAFLERYFIFLSHLRRSSSHEIRVSVGNSYWNRFLGTKRGMFPPVENALPAGELDFPVRGPEMRRGVPDPVGFMEINGHRFAWFSHS